MNQNDLLARLEARIAFRKRWYSSFMYRKPRLSELAVAWELAYDRKNNFARMGSEFVPDGWGIAAPTKKRGKVKAALKMLQAAE